MAIFIGPFWRKIIRIKYLFEGIVHSLLSFPSFLRNGWRRHMFCTLAFMIILCCSFCCFFVPLFVILNSVSDPLVRHLVSFEKSKAEWDG